MDRSKNIILVCGARPNFMKIAPIVNVLERYEHIDSLLVHTGQHYDKKMSNLFFDELGIPKPDIDLGVGSSSHAIQTADIMKHFEPVCIDYKPDMIVVVGDINSTIACALVGAKLNIPIVHVEAGLRSGDRSMPEEINRILTDAISDLLFVTEPSGIKNLTNEGVDSAKIHFVGNVMIDTLLKHREKADKSGILDHLGLAEGNFATVTLHRPSNVDKKDILSSILSALETISRDLPMVFPVHPRTRNTLISFGFLEKIEKKQNFHLTEPLGYLDFLKLTSSAALVLTDSGGIQEETTILGVPCLTLRENTERPVTLTQGTNQLVHPDKESILKAYSSISQYSSQSAIPDLWDGNAAERIVKIISEY